MRFRSFALLGASLALLCLYCNQSVGNFEYGQVAADGATCMGNGDCASFVCESGTCKAPPPGQIEIDGTCGGAGVCVADATCMDGICVQTSTCAGEGQLCTSGTPCCSGFVCNEDDSCAVPGGGTGGSNFGTGGSTGTGGEGGFGTGGSGSCGQSGSFCDDSDQCCSFDCDTDADECN